MEKSYFEGGVVWKRITLDRVLSKRGTLKLRYIGGWVVCVRVLHIIKGTLYYLYIICLDVERAAPSV